MMNERNHTSQKPQVGSKRSIVARADVKVGFGLLIFELVIWVYIYPVNRGGDEWCGMWSKWCLYSREEILITYAASPGAEWGAVIQVIDYPSATATWLQLMCIICCSKAAAQLSCLRLPAHIQNNETINIARFMCWEIRQNTNRRKHRLDKHLSERTTARFNANFVLFLYEWTLIS